MPLRETKHYQSAISAWLSPPEGWQSATIDEMMVTADASGNKVLPSAAPLAMIPGSDFYRWLPRAKVAAEVSTSDDTIQLGKAQCFVAGDMLSVIAPYAQINFALAWANGDTATIEIDGQPLSHTVSAFSSLTALANAIADDINADLTLSRKVVALAETQHIHIYASDFLSTYPIAVSKSVAGTGTIDIENSFTNLQPNQSIGTVADVSITDTTQSVTLDANSTLRLPVAMPIGNPSYQPLNGLNSFEHDLLNESGIVSTAFIGSLFKDRLPYWDGQLAALLPQIAVY